MFADAMNDRMIRLQNLARSIDTGMWTGVYRTPETMAVAERVKENVLNKVERFRRVLRFRYGMDV